MKATCTLTSFIPAAKAQEFNHENLYLYKCSGTPPHPVVRTTKNNPGLCSDCGQPLTLIEPISREQIAEAQRLANGLPTKQN